MMQSIPLPCGYVSGLVHLEMVVKAPLCSESAQIDILVHLEDLLAC